MFGMIKLKRKRELKESQNNLSIQSSRGIIRIMDISKQTIPLNKGLKEQSKIYSIWEKKLPLKSMGMEGLHQHIEHFFKMTMKIPALILSRINSEKISHPNLLKVRILEDLQLTKYHHSSKKFELIKKLYSIFLLMWFWWKWYLNWKTAYYYGYICFVFKNFYHKWMYQNLLSDNFIFLRAFSRSFA